jgi:hypothetical protein
VLSTPLAVTMISSMALSSAANPAAPCNRINPVAQATLVHFENLIFFSFYRSAAFCLAKAVPVYGKTFFS